MLMMRTNKQRSVYTHGARARPHFYIHWPGEHIILFFQGYAHFIRWSCDDGDIFSFRSTDKPGGSNCDKIREEWFHAHYFCRCPLNRAAYSRVSLGVCCIAIQTHSHNIRRRRRRQINKYKNINKLPRVLLASSFSWHTHAAHDVFLRAHSKYPSTCPRPYTVK